VQVVDDAFAAAMNMTKEEVIFAVERMQEVNPMLGLRGCRLGVVIPELVEMQSRALVEAAINLKFKRHLDPRIEIMVPLVGCASEYKHQAALIRKTAQDTCAGSDLCTINLMGLNIGTMIEVPRAALTAGEIAAAGADFFSYGTNDLTQMTYGLSRDDVGRFLPTYLKQGLFDVDPFQTIDEKGVGDLICRSAATGKTEALAIGNNKFKAGVCGEHGGDPTSVRFFSRIGLDYVSCSPFRVPLARLAAAQAVIEQEKEFVKKESE